MCVVSFCVVDMCVYMLVPVVSLCVEWMFVASHTMRRHRVLAHCGIVHGVCVLLWCVVSVVCLCLCLSVLLCVCSLMFIA